MQNGNSRLPFFVFHSSLKEGGVKASGRTSPLLIQLQRHIQQQPVIEIPQIQPGQF
jgi:hypothetical protein